MPPNHKEALCIIQLPPPAGRAKIKFAVLCVTALVVSSSILSAADAPYIGKWKLNQAKSQLTGETLSIEKTADGEVHFRQGDRDNIFKLDGKEYPQPSGPTVAVKVADPNTWDVVVKVNNKVTSNQHLSVSGDALSATIQQVKPDGTTMQVTIASKRVSGGWLVRGDT